MNWCEFEKFILSIGFKYDTYRQYEYKKYNIYLDRDHYDFYNGSEWICYIKLDDLRLLNKIIREYKLKNILG